MKKLGRNVNLVSTSKAREKHPGNEVEGVSKILQNWKILDLALRLL